MSEAMMARSRSFLTATVAATISATLILSGCSGSASDTGDRNATTAGEPVLGGIARILQPAEPRSLDPAALTNSWAHQPVIGNALYGTLMINDTVTLEIEYTMATDFSTTDDGTNFVLTLQPGLTFTDGNPLDAAAVKFNWDRLRDPALGSTSIRQAAQVTSTEVIDATTLKVALVSANPNFAQGLINTGMNWIASPTALQKGQGEFDKAPIGAGPFTLAKWTRQDTIELEKNPRYWDAPKPYLDGITIRMPADSTQRVNTITTDGADLSSEASWMTLSKAEEAGFSTEVVPTGGGQFIAMNIRRAPFNDERARQAVVLAADTDALNSSVYSGKGQIAQTLFPESSPFYTNISLHTQNKEKAQKLFDELAAEGKPVTFTFLSYPTTESKSLGESLQAQLSAFKNVQVQVEVADYAAVTARAGSRDFDTMISTAVIADPDYALWTAFHGLSPGNFTGINDPELNAALDAGRTSTTVEGRKRAYETVQDRLVALTPVLWTIRPAPSVMAGKNLRGIEMYALGSPLPEELWLQK
ncbi:ABC transporter substrate-binding protein [Rhodococcus globerulus]|uniref:ABC transporter substrate-binding protein n=1 Tax=Rhodococcus globerulus TaxID=33008 RepID=A0ABU4BM38_RHOGO|nr:ABC transporter substrate-binding protein [Rhodococcus globerulus]MDV6265179.1 ABC transporter substrate-binding protein [Rhodococcus globerulus]